MKRFLVIGFALSLMSSAGVMIKPFQSPIQPLQAKPHTLVHIENDSLVYALIHVESRGNDSAYCASEDAVGCLQIRKIMIREVNRILKSQRNSIRYKMKDRWSRPKSIEIFNIYCAHYNLVTEEEKARCWNGGPRGLTKKATQKYWNKVNNQLDR